MAESYPPPAKRNVITLFTMIGAFMTQLDATIANVALPHMQASTSASREQITWVLTSYIIMAAIVTPLTGWLANRYGRKRLYLLSIVGFTLASMLCGMAANFGQLVGFRVLQGIMGAALLPMSQAILLDINPPERHGSAIAIWGVGAVLGPIIGPVLGGYLTDYLNWRWIFFINLPFGILSAIGLMLYMDETRTEKPGKLDLFGYCMLALAVGSMQLILDRGQMLDWFESWEIRLEAVVAVTAFYLFIVHTLTTKNPFANPKLFRDPNYVIGNVFGFFMGGLMYGVMALTPPMLAELMGYPAQLIGIVSTPRGFGTLITMLFAGRMINYVDSRLMIFIGLIICGASMYMMAHFSLDMDSWPIILSGFIQGVGAGIMFVPVATIAFATISPSIRNEAAAMNSLIRNLGGSVWIAVLQTITIRNAAIVQSRLTEEVRPDNPVVAMHLPDFDFTSILPIATMDMAVIRQALMVAYVDSFYALFLACLVVAPLALLLKPPAKAP